MKPTVISILMFFLAATGFAQERVSEREVLGTWKLNVDIREAIDQESEEMGFFEGMMAKAFSGMAADIMDEIDITFDFRKNNVLYLTVHTDFDEDETETEELYWEINDKGQLFIEDIDNNEVQIDNDGYWMKSDGKLVAIDKDGSTEHLAWMERTK